MCNCSDTFSAQKNEWILMVINEQNRILASKNKTPIQILIEVFELFDENFDLSIIKEIKLYDCLLDIFEKHKLTPFIRPFNHHYSSLFNLVKIFNNNKKEIRKFSVELFYALLNFIDALKIDGIYIIDN